jgi:CO/xanthine dehydrogenase Mo-binding subunit
MRRINTIMLTVTVLAAAGCASIAVTDEAIVDRTAFALGLNKSDFTVSNRIDEGTTTRYQVRTRSGQEFNCFVGGSISVLGRSVSEAVCTKKGEPARNPLLK